MKRCQRALCLGMLIACTVFPPAFARQDFVHQQFDYGTGRVIVDAPVHEIDLSASAPCSVRIRHWSADEIKSALFPNCSVEVAYKAFPDGRTNPAEKEAFPYASITYAGEDGSNCATDWDGGLYYYTQDFTRQHFDLVSSYPKLLTSQTIDGFDKSAAHSHLASAFALLGAELGDIQYYALDPKNEETARMVDEIARDYEQTLRQYTSDYAQTGNEQSKIDLEVTQKILAVLSKSMKSGYWAQISFQIDGVNLFPWSRYHAGLDTLLPSGSATAYVTQDGVQCIRMDGYDVCFEVLERKKPQTPLDLDQALRRLQKKYDAILFEGDLIFDKISYCYVPEPVKGETLRFTLQPAWCFWKKGRDEEAFAGMNANDPVVFNALTGKEMR